MTQMKFKLSNFKILGLSLGLLFFLFSSINLHSMAPSVFVTPPFDAANQATFGNDYGVIGTGPNQLNLYVTDYTNNANVLYSFNTVVIPLYIAAQAINATAIEKATTDAAEAERIYTIMNKLVIALHWSFDRLWNADHNNNAYPAPAAFAATYGGGLIGLTGAAIGPASLTTLPANINQAQALLEIMIESGLRVNFGNALIDAGAHYSIRPYTNPITAGYEIPWFNDVTISGTNIKGYNVTGLQADGSKMTALASASPSHNNNVSLTAILTGIGASNSRVPPPSTHSAETLVNAAKSGNQVDVRNAIAAGVNVNTKNAAGDTALIAATLALDESMIDLLLAQAGIDKELAGKSGRSAAGLLRNKGADEAKTFGFDTSNEPVYQAKRKAIFTKLKA